MKPNLSLSGILALAVLFAAAGAAQIIVIPTTLPNGVVGVPYQQDVTTETHGAFVWTITQGALPPGLTITQFFPPGAFTQSGRIAGTPTTVGTFTFTVTGTLGANTGSRQYTVIITAPTGPITVLPTALNFAGFSRGELPPQQFVVVNSAGTTAVAFTVTIDDGAGGPQPPWIGSLTGGTTPSRLPVEADPGALAPGTYRARLRIRSGTGAQTDVAVTFDVIAVAPKLDVNPRSLRFAGQVGRAGVQTQDLLLTSVGGGSPIPYNSTIVNNSPWLSLTTNSGTTSNNNPQLMRVRANTTGLPLGGLRDTIRITSAAGNFDITVLLFITADGPILQLGDSGSRRTLRQGNGIPFNELIRVFNIGSAGSVVNWNATKRVAPGATDPLTITTASGRSVPGTSSTLNFGPAANADTLPVGVYYALITVSDPAAINSPQFAVFILEVVDPSAPPLPDITAGSLVFTGIQNGTAVIPAQNAGVFIASNASLPIQAAANTFDGGRWLNISRAAGTLSTPLPFVFAVSVDPAGLLAGVYQGQVDIVVAGSIRSITVLLILLPAGATLGTELETAAAPAAPDKTRAVTGCTASQIVIAPGLIGNFSTPAAWPASINARLFDNCGTALPGGSVVASFSNGDSPLTLSDYNANGTYQATWTPAFPSASATVTFSASVGTLPPNTTQIVGGVSANRFAPPQLFDGGTVNNTNPLGGSVLAPGTVTAVYGQNLASSTVSPGVIPLVSTFNGTTLIMGGIPAPFYFLSGGQLNVQAPVELPVNQQASVAVQVNTAFAVLPNPVGIIPAAPGISSFPDSTIIAQHGDFTLITSTSPAKAGESIVTYVSGMGATSPVVASGIQTPNQLVPATLPPTVTVNGVNAAVIYGGLTPGGIGLYQINFTVPASTRPGDATVVITQNGIIANLTKLPVVAP